MSSNMFKCIHPLLIISNFTTNKSFKAVYKHLEPCCKIRLERKKKKVHTFQNVLRLKDIRYALFLNIKTSLVINQAPLSTELSNIISSRQ